MPGGATDLQMQLIEPLFDQNTTAVDSGTGCWQFFKTRCTSANSEITFSNIRLSPLDQSQCTLSNAPSSSPSSSGPTEIPTIQPTVTPCNMWPLTLEQDPIIVSTGPSDDVYKKIITTQEMAPLFDLPSYEVGSSWLFRFVASSTCSHYLQFNFW